MTVPVIDPAARTVVEMVPVAIEATRHVVEVRRVVPVEVTVSTIAIRIHAMVNVAMVMVVPAIVSMESTRFRRVVGEPTESEHHRCNSCKDCRFHSVLPLLFRLANPVVVLPAHKTKRQKLRLGDMKTFRNRNNPAQLLDT